MRIYKIIDASLYGQANGLMARDPEQARQLSREIGTNDPIELAGRWEPIEVVPCMEHPGKPLGDFSFLGAENLLVMSRRAVEALGGELRAHGELLPLRSTAGEFYFFNVLRDVDAMDFDRSEVDWRVEGESISKVYFYAFRPERLEGVLVFTMPYHGRKHYFVSEAFKERAERAGLEGFLFALVWDSEDRGYWDQRYEREQWEHVKRLRRAERFGLHVSPAPAPAAPVPAPAPAMRPLGPQEEANKAQILRNALERLNALDDRWLNGQEEPRLIAERVAGAVERLRGQRYGEEQLRRVVIDLGLLWGEQAVRGWGWRWARLEEEWVVVAPDAAVYVSPVVFVYGFFREPAEPNTVLLLFNLLGDPRKRPPGATPGAYLRLG